MSRSGVVCWMQWLYRLWYKILEDALILRNPSTASRFFQSQTFVVCEVHHMQILQNLKFWSTFIECSIRAWNEKQLVNIHCNNCCILSLLYYFSFLLAMHFIHFIWNDLPISFWILTTSKCDFPFGSCERYALMLSLITNISCFEQCRSFNTNQAWCWTYNSAHMKSMKCSDGDPLLLCIHYSSMFNASINSIGEYLPKDLK
jgi:hypothetical protein